VKAYRIEAGSRWYCPAEKAVERMHANGLEWTYPWEGEEVRDGLRLHAYKTSNRAARIACFMSHFFLWEKCASGEEPIVILEDDAVEVEPLPGVFFGAGYGAFSLNDPRGATRRAQQYHALIQAQGVPIAPVPLVDVPEVPQGLPGHSAYVIAPWLAALLVAKAREVGAWPNDCLMNRQFFPGALGCSTTYYFKVSGRPSSLA